MTQHTVTTFEASVLRRVRFGLRVGGWHRVAENRAALRLEEKGLIEREATWRPWQLTASGREILESETS